MIYFVLAGKLHLDPQTRNTVNFLKCHCFSKHGVLSKNVNDDKWKKEMREFKCHA